jgi:carboxyl-terminal processing protease
MNRKFLGKLAVIGCALCAALFLTVCRPSPRQLVPFGIGPAEVRAAPGTSASQLRANYDLTSLKVFNQTLVKIRDNYVDPERIDPKAMLLAALDSVQRNIPEVLVEPRQDEVVVTVNDKTKTFAIGDVDTVWTLASRLKEIFRFVQASMNPASDPAQIEYAAVNGMLSTLDPHSVLLDPEAAREMDISTSGKFGGIGIVIRMPKGKLTVVSLISDDTPAAKAGLKAGDHIIAINNEPTANLTLNEAMNRLRGDPQTKVTVTIERGGVAGQNDYVITRDVIHVSSVKARLLKGGVGYVKIEQFSSDTGRDLKRALEDLRRQGAKAWVLDLRGNPGGLLDQAVNVTDLFVDSGTIVTTVGNAGKQREEKRARADGPETKAPLAVLVNGGSASASEIVAGALKNLDRGVIIGQTTFGKGSVQVLFDFDDGSKLKLTIAQYLTPGDVSIQSVGITPDIELVPVVVPAQIKTPRDAMRLLGLGKRGMHESDLDAHLTSKNTLPVGKPTDTVRYLYAPKPDAYADDDEDGAVVEEPTAPEDGFEEDFEIRFARDFVAQASSARRKDDLDKSKAFVQKRKTEEEAGIGAALAVLGIDWNTAASSAGAKLSAQITTDHAGNRVNAGDVLAITGTVTNTGTAPASRVHGFAKTDDYTFEYTELAFGRIDPGQTRTFTTYVRVPRDAEDRVDDIRWEFTEAGGAAVDVAPLKLTVTAQPRPLFAYTYQLIDDGGNGDGLLQVGESVRLRATVKNEGKGAALRTTAMLRNASGDGVVVNKGRFELDKIPPGESRTVEFTFDVKKDFEPAELTLELSVYDATLREAVNEKLRIPVRPAAAGPRAGSGVVKVKSATAQILEGAAGDAAPIATAKKGALFRETGRLGTWVRIELEAGRPGFIAASDVGSASGQPSAAFATVWRVTPPSIALKVPSLETSGDRWHLEGSAVDDNHVEDIYVVVSNRDAKIEARKVYYLSNRGKASPLRLDFAADIPVWPGSNMVTIVARENDEVRTIQTLFILRSGPAQATAPAPAPAPVK